MASDRPSKKKHATSKKPKGTVERLPLYLMEGDADNLMSLLSSGRFENKAAAVRWALRVAAFVETMSSTGSVIIRDKQGAETKLILL